LQSRSAKALLRLSRKQDRALVRAPKKWARELGRLLKRLDKGPGSQSKKRAGLPKVQAMPLSKQQVRHRTGQAEPPSKHKTLRDRQPSRVAVRPSRRRRREANSSRTLCRPPSTRLRS
jgi:hypothetical protein